MQIPPSRISGCKLMKSCAYKVSWFESQNESKPSTAKVAYTSSQFDEDDGMSTGLITLGGLHLQESKLPKKSYC